ncbi:MAG: hypothetical protein IT450_16810 [Phycisphaerales bacterium]|nr:hypothetical protein [Phycisphaerales bacterium]
MSSSPEMMPYKLDITDVEAKAARMQDLLGKIASGRAAKQDTSELEKQLLGEMEAMSKSTGKTKEADSAIQTLVKQKEKLGSVVGLLGGQFGGLIGQLGNVIELFVVFGTVAAVPAALIAGVTALVGLYNSQAAAMKEAADEAERLLEAQKKLSEAGRSEEDTIRPQLEAAGVYGKTTETLKRAVALAAGGVGSKEDAIQQAIFESIGLSEEDAAAAMRGRLLGADVGLGADRRENIGKLRRAAAAGRSSAGAAAYEAHRFETEGAGRQWAQGIRTTDVSTTQFGPALRRFVEEKKLPQDVADELAKTLRTGESSMTRYWSGGGPTSGITQTAASLADELVAEFKRRGLTISDSEREQGPTYIYQTNIQTANMGAGAPWASPHDEGHKSAPGSNSLQRR